MTEHHHFFAHDRRSARYTMLGTGLVMFGIGIALLLSAGLGVDPWDVLHQGLAETIGASFGSVINGVAIVVLVAWIPLKQRPGVGTIANAVVVGVVADAALRVLPEPASPPLQVVMLATGILVIGAATGLYIGAGLGPGPRDGLMTGLAGRTRFSVRVVRTGLEVTALGLGWLLGGHVGAGTAIYALTIGPVTQRFMELLELPPAPLRIDAAKACT